MEKKEEDIFVWAYANENSMNMNESIILLCRSWALSETWIR